MMLLKCCSQYVSKFVKLSRGHRIKKVSFHSNHKAGQCQRMFKLQYNCTHVTCQQYYGQNPSSQASVVHESRTYRCRSWIQKSQGNHRSNCQHPLDHRNKKGILKKACISDSLTMLNLLTVEITTNNGKFLKRWEYKITLHAS